MSDNAISVGIPFKRPYRFVMAVLLLLCPLCTMVPYVAPAVYMMDIMETFQCDLDLAGFSMTIQLGATGICMFISTFIQDKLGVRKSIITAIFLMAFGNILAFLAPSMFVFLMARFFSGFGQGMYSVSMTPCLSTWFEGKERTYIITFSNVSNSLALALSYAINRPLANLIGSWQRSFLVYAVGISLIGVAWLLLSKDSPETPPKRTAEKTAFRDSSLARACREPQYWKLMIFASLFYMANSSIATFLPTYLTTERSIDASIASSISSLNSLVGIVGALIGGFLCAQLPLRKPTMLVAASLYVLVGIGLTVFTSGGVVLCLALAAGALFNIPTTTQSTIMIETKKPFDPTILGGAVCIVAGLPQLCCVAVSFIFSAIAGAFDMTMAYRVFFLSVVIGIISILLTKETGTQKSKEVHA